MVREMRLFTVSTDSDVSFAVGKLLTKIWNPIVRRDPFLDASHPNGGAGMIEKPEGRRARKLESPPFITRFIDCMSTGAYTNSEPD